MDEDLLRALGERQRASEPSERNGEELSEDLPPELAALLEPIEGEEADDLIDGAMQRLEASESGDSASSEVPKAPAATDESAANWKGAVAVVVAMAAALVLWFGMSSGGGGTMPEYSVVSLQSGAAAMRSDDGGGVVRRKVSTPAGGPIDWRFSPAGTVPGPVAVALLATNATGDSKLSKPQGVEVSAAGAVRIAGPLDRFIALSPGTWAVEVLIGPADSLPSSPDAANEGRRDAGWQSVPLEVTITAP